MVQGKMDKEQLRNFMRTRVRKSCASSVALIKQEMRKKAKDVEDCLNCEVSSRKTEAKKNAWNLKNMFFPKETGKKETKRDEVVDSDESDDDSDDEKCKETNEIELSSDGNDSEEEHNSAKHEKKKKEKVRRPSEMTENVAQAMKRLESIVIDCCSDSENL